MRKIKLTLFFIVLIVLLVFPPSAKALGSCGTVSLNTGSVSRLSPVTISITGASSDFYNKNVYVGVFRTSDQALVSGGTGSILIGSNGNGQATLFKGVFYDPGSYFIVVSPVPINSLDAKDTTRCSDSLPSLQVTGETPGPLRNPTEEQKAGIVIPQEITKTCSNGEKGIDTAIGCIPIESSEGLISFILSWALGIAGGIAFLLILLAGFQIMTSRGDPNRLKAGQELLTSAIAGVVLLIFSIFILRIIGVNILGIFPK